jgi:hypothetical protein
VEHLIEMRSQQNQRDQYQRGDGDRDRSAAAKLTHFENVQRENRQRRGPGQVQIPSHEPRDPRLLGGTAQDFRSDRHDDRRVKREPTLPKGESGDEEKTTQCDHGGRITPSAINLARNSTRSGSLI